MPTKMMYVAFHGSDLDRALEFYTERLGLETRVDFPGPDGRFLTVAPPGEAVEILLWPGPQDRGVIAAESGVAPGAFSLESDDLGRDFDRLRHRGVSFVDPEPIDYPSGIWVTVLDPDGHRGELRQKKHG